VSIGPVNLMENGAIFCPPRHCRGGEKLEGRVTSQDGKRYLRKSWVGMRGNLQWNRGYLHHVLKREHPKVKGSLGGRGSESRGKEEGSKQGEEII